MSITNRAKTWIWAIATAATISGGGLAFNWYMSHLEQTKTAANGAKKAQAAIAAVKNDMDSHEQMEEQLLGTVGKISRQLEVLSTFYTRVVGRAGIHALDAPGEFVFINSRGDAQMYLNAKAANVTIRNITISLPIKGKVVGARNGPILTLSHSAARAFGIDPTDLTQETSEVEITPAGDEPDDGL